MKNHCHKYRKKQAKDGDASVVLAYFWEKKVDPTYFLRYIKGDKGMLKNLFGVENDHT